MIGPVRSALPDAPEDATAGSGPVTVVLVDDYAVVRRGLQTCLHEVPGIRTVGEAGDGPAALELLDALARAGRSPDVALVDLQMPRMDGVETTRLMTQRHPQVKVVVLSSYGQTERARAALRAGAVGYLLKDAEPEEIVAAVRTVAPGGGRVYLHPQMARRLTQSLLSPATGLSVLTPREKDILSLVATGCSNRQIADLLGIRERTARTHVSNVLAKMHLTSRTQAALVAVREGLVGLPGAPEDAVQPVAAGPAAAPVWGRM